MTEAKSACSPMSEDIADDVLPFARASRYLPRDKNAVSIMVVS
ncbi:MAG: hypothetical protein BWY05_01458 [Euryarchaeota archaeon ADurb.Bin165]|nr:MAG: hypothetical protein BWY05_01458 [Euryarchaeota archaeon ADurb.Bin165]